MKRKEELMKKSIDDFEKPIFDCGLLIAKCVCYIQNHLRGLLISSNYSAKRGYSKSSIFTKILIQFIFWLHLPIVVLWFGLFLVPTSIWSGRITFHFWFMVIITLIQFLWGLVYFPITHKIDIICPLTTLMQSLRGFSFRSKKNYGHSFIAELLEKLRLKVSYRWVNWLLISTLILIVVEYVWWR